MYIENTSGYDFAQPSPVLDGVCEPNILFLGETGIGIPTFTNGRAAQTKEVYAHMLVRCPMISIYQNHLTYSTLEERNVTCIIPSTLAWLSPVNDDYVLWHIKFVPHRGKNNNSQSLHDEQDGPKFQTAREHTIYTGLMLVPPLFVCLIYLASEVC